MAESKEVWWTTPTESEDGRTIMVSGRECPETIIKSGKYNDRVELTWRYADTPGGMPDEQTAALMEQADDALRQVLKKERGCQLTGIYTGAGQRDWVFYVKSTGIFQAMLNRAWTDLPLLPVTIYAEKDPDWAEYREMVDATYIPDEE